MIKQLFYTIDQLFGKYLSIWQEVCNIESPTNYKNGVDSVSRYFEQIATKKGWKIEKLNQENAGNVVCITINPNIKTAPITLSGHIDTVHTIGSFGTPTVRVENGKIYGPGVVDCKGGVVAGMMALEVLDNCNFTARPVRLIMQTDEEVGSSISNKQTINFICEKSKDSLAFINLEGHTKGEACLERKGILTYTFKVKGQIAHSSNCAIWGANAIAEASYKIIELEKLKDHEGITCNCGVISGGTVVNSVPDYCEFKANFRFKTKAQKEWIDDFVRKLASNSTIKGASCEVELSSSRLAMEISDKNIELLEKINRVLENAGLQPLVKSKRSGGSDAAEITAYGIPCVDSMGVEGDMIHSTNEYGIVESLRSCAQRLVAIINGIN